MCEKKCYNSFADVVAEVEEYITNSGFDPNDWDTETVARECYRALPNWAGYEPIGDTDDFTDSLERNAYLYRIAETVGSNTEIIAEPDFRADALAAFDKRMNLARRERDEKKASGDYAERWHYLCAERATRDGEWDVFAYIVLECGE